WFRYPLYTTAFQASFTYQNIGGGGADGMAFVLQNGPFGADAIGGGGGGLGFYGISPSVAVMFNIYAGSPGGASGIIVATNGMIYNNGYWPSIYQNTAPVNFAGGNPVNVTLQYAQNKLQITLVDTITTASYTTNVTINLLPYLGSDSAYVGVTGSEGGFFSHQVVSNLKYTPLPTLQAVRSGPGQVTLQWAGTIYGFRIQASVPGSGTWSDVSGTITANGGFNQITLPASSSVLFYRLVL
ncbi:MAG TPA: hypothetical protein VF607_01390, partial [Verrucomicrobiae bacterium]